MATCIVSRAMQLDGAAAVSGILLAAGIAAYLVLAAVYAARFAINRAGVRADAADPGRAFGFFTLAAGSDVLAARLAADDHLAAAAVLLVIGGVSWAGLGYLLPPLLAGRGLAGAPPAHHGRLAARPAPGTAGLRAGDVEHGVPDRHVRGGQP
jgi:hypothetical protein